MTNSYHQPRTSCWNHCLKQILHRKQANQVSPAKHGSTAIKSDELELQDTSSSQQMALPNVATVQNNVDDTCTTTEKSLENCVGNVYLGSPHRRRHYLEPLYLQPPRNPTDFHCSNSPLHNEAIRGGIVTASTTGKTLPEGEQPPANTSLSSGSSHGRRRHNSTSPTLPPIMETDGAPAGRHPPPLQRSISSQSLHSLRSEDGEHASEDWNKGLGEKTNSSLSNLLLGVAEDEVFDNGNADDDVREVHFTQSPVKDRPPDRLHEDGMRHSSQSFPILKTQDRTHPLFDTSHRVPRLSRCMSLNEMTYSHPRSNSLDRGFSASNETRNVVYLGKVAQTAPSCNIIESSCANQYGADQGNDVHVYHKGTTFTAVQEITTIPMFDSVVMDYHSTYRQSPVV